MKLKQLDDIVRVLHPVYGESHQYTWGYKADLWGMPRGEREEALLSGVDLNDHETWARLANEVGVTTLNAMLEREEAYQRGDIPRAEQSYNRMVRDEDEFLERLGKEGTMQRRVAASALAGAGVSINVAPANLRRYLATVLDKEEVETSPQAVRRYGTDNYWDLRVLRERTLGIAASGKPTDPFAVYGAVTMPSQSWQEFGGAPFYGGVALHLDVPKIEDRLSLTIGDSFYARHRARPGVSWGKRDQLAPQMNTDGTFAGRRLTALYAEAQVHGGLRGQAEISHASLAASINPEDMDSIIGELEGRRISYKIIDGFGSTYRNAFSKYYGEERVVPALAR